MVAIVGPTALHEGGGYQELLMVSQPLVIGHSFWSSTYNSHLIVGMNEPTGGRKTIKRLQLKQEAMQHEYALNISVDKKPLPSQCRLLTWGLSRSA